MAQSEKEKEDVLYVRLNNDLKGKIEQAAKAKFVSVSAFVRIVLSEHIEKEEMRHGR